MEEFRIFGYYDHEYQELKREMQNKNYGTELLYFLISKDKLECKKKDRIVFKEKYIGNIYGINVYVEI